MDIIVKGKATKIWTTSKGREFGPKWPCELAIANDGTFYKGPG